MENMGAQFANKREELCQLVQAELVFTSIQGLLYHHALRSHEDCLALGKRALQTKKVCEHKIMCNFSSLVPRPTPFFVLRFVFNIIHGGGRAREKRGRPGNTCHVNDVWWTRGGRRGGGAQLRITY